MLSNIEKILEKRMYERFYSFLHNKIVYNLQLDSDNSILHPILKLI